jgi:hypothetical protein
LNWKDINSLNNCRHEALLLEFIIILIIQTYIAELWGDKDRNWCYNFCVLEFCYFLSI